MERDIHFWLEEPESATVRALWTISEGRYCVAKALPIEQAMAALSEHLEQCATGAGER